MSKNVSKKNELKLKVYLSKQNNDVKSGNKQVKNNNGKP